jgi:tetrapyrrole methylase family protein/MazG family protein
MAKKPFDELVDIMRRLRGDDGCPWDREQDHKSIRPYLVEETYEVIEAIDEEDYDKIKEELGDLLLQIVFHAQMAEEKNRFNIDDVINHIIVKIKNRHPHIFQSTKVKDSKEVLKNWEQIKMTEGRTSVLDGVPKELPALLKAARIQEKAARVGFDWDKIDGVFAKVEEEVAEFRSAYKEKNKEKIEEELGDMFFALVNLSRFLDTNPEDALRGTIDKFIKRFQYIERELESRGLKPSQVTLEEMDEIWEEAKGK